jgi:hypothetical protein
MKAFGNIILAILITLLGILVLNGWMHLIDYGISISGFWGLAAGLGPLFAIVMFCQLHLELPKDKR